MLVDCSSMKIENASFCENASQSNGLYCNSKTFSVKAKPNYANDFTSFSGSIKISLNTPEVQRYQTVHDFIDLIIENRPTSQCHIATFGHLITLDQWKHDITFRKTKNAVQNWHFLHQSGDFQALVKFKKCPKETIFSSRHRDEIYCACGLKSVENTIKGPIKFEIDSCTNESDVKISSEPEYPIKMSWARNKTVAFVSCFMT